MSKKQEDLVMVWDKLVHKDMIWTTFPAPSTTRTTEELRKFVQKWRKEWKDTEKYFPSERLDFRYDDNNNLLVMQCPFCREIDYPEIRTHNKIWLEVILYCLFLIPWIIYSALTRHTYYCRCKHCKNEQIISYPNDIK